MLSQAFTGSFALPLKSRHGKNWSKDSMMQVSKETSWVSLKVRSTQDQTARVEDG